jgi:hypothetical protein
LKGKCERRKRERERGSRERERKVSSSLKEKREVEGLESAPEESSGERAVHFAYVVSAVSCKRQMRGWVSHEWKTRLQ